MVPHRRQAVVTGLASMRAAPGTGRRHIERRTAFIAGNGRRLAGVVGAAGTGIDP